MWSKTQPPKTYFYSLKIEQEEFFSYRPFKGLFAVPLPAVKKYFWRKWMNSFLYTLWVWEILIRSGLIFFYSFRCRWGCEKRVCCARRAEADFQHYLNVILDFSTFRSLKSFLNTLLLIEHRGCVLCYFKLLCLNYLLWCIVKNMYFMYLFWNVSVWGKIRMKNLLKYLRASELFNPLLSVLSGLFHSHDIYVLRFSVGLEIFLA